MSVDVEDDLSSKSQNSKVFWGAPTVKRIKNIFSISKSPELIKWNATACGGESSILRTIDYLARQQFFVKFTSAYGTPKENLLRNYNILSNYSHCKDMEVAKSIPEITSKSFTNIDRLKMFLKPIDRHFPPKINRVLALSSEPVADGEAISKVEVPVLAEDASMQAETVNVEENEFFHKMYNVAVSQKLAPEELFITLDKNAPVSEPADLDQSSDVHLLKSADVEHYEDFWDTPKFPTRKLATPKRLITSKTSADVDSDFTINVSDLLFPNDAESVEIDRKFLLKQEDSLVVPEEDGSESETVNVPSIIVDGNSTMTLFNEECGLVVPINNENEVETLHPSHGHVPSRSSLPQSSFNCCTLKNEEALLNIGYLQIPEPHTFETKTGKKTSEEMNSHNRTAKKSPNLEPKAVIKKKYHGCDLKMLPKSLPSRITPNFKNVLSPVGMYIKNSPRVPQIKRIYTRSAVNQPMFAKIATRIIPENKENEEANLPNRLYKPAMHSFTTNAEGSQAKFSKKIQKLIKASPEVIKHKGRVNKKESDLDSVEAKLLKEDLTMSFSVLNVSSGSAQDVSLLSVRKAYIK